jgi:hypothetical protein
MTDEALIESVGQAIWHAQWEEAWPPPCEPYPKRVWAHRLMPTGPLVQAPSLNLR